MEGSYIRKQVPRFTTRLTDIMPGDFRCLVPLCMEICTSPLSAEIVLRVLTDEL
jgi:hypothetical protein